MPYRFIPSMIISVSDGSYDCDVCQAISANERDDGEICFAMQISDPSVKALWQLTQDWDNLRGEAILLKYRDTVFREQLPATPPQRSMDVVAETKLLEIPQLYTNSSA